jgi:hypothetical protein
VRAVVGRSLLGTLAVRGVLAPVAAQECLAGVAYLRLQDHGVSIFNRETVCCRAEVTRGRCAQEVTR